MSRRLIDRSPDLLALQNSGLNIQVQGGYLLIKDVPYVTSARQVRADGVLISSLERQVVDGYEVTARPQQHTTYWIGEHPCQADGQRIRSFEHPSGPQDLGGGLRVDFMFSAYAAYRDYCHKMRAYLGWIVAEAEKLDRTVRPETFPVYATEENDADVFHYVDTAASRVGIGADNDKLQGQRVGIIGLGGTGSYILDSVAKTRVEVIRLIDSDTFDPHNAFRAPGAWSLAELGAKKSKVANYLEIYGKLRRCGLEGHEVNLTAENLHLLDGLNFVFMCLDQGRDKRAIVDWLVERNVPFIDVGMGITRGPNGLQGLVRTVTGTPRKYDHLESRMSFGNEDEMENLYATNIQVAELNALNAAMAVLRRKRLMGFYRDAGGEHYSAYQIATGQMINEDCE